MYTKNTMQTWLCQPETYTMYTRGDYVLKKTESVTYRTDAKIKAALAIIAAEKKWSISQLTEEIVRQWLQENRPELLEKE